MLESIAISRHRGLAIAGRVSNIWAHHDRDYVARITSSSGPHKVGRYTLPLSAFDSARRRISQKSARGRI